MLIKKWTSLLTFKFLLSRQNTLKKYIFIFIEDANLKKKIYITT